ncbi:MAG: pseudouridine synthase [Bacteroidia bacterium]
MRYSSDKKFSKAGPSGKKDHSASRFSGKRDNKDKPFRSKDGAFKPDRKRFGDKKEGTSEDRRSFKKADERPKKSFGRDSDKKEFTRSDKPARFKKPFRRDDEKEFKGRDKDDRSKKPFRRDEEKSSRKPYGKGDSERSSEKRSYSRKEEGHKSDRSFDKDDRKPARRSFGGDKEESRERKIRPRKEKSEGLPSYTRETEEKPEPKRSLKYADREEKHYRPFKKEQGDGKKRYRDDDQPFHKKHKSKQAPEKEFDGLTRLNKYLSNAGVCSRREADDLIRAGAVKVNGVVITEMGFKVKSSDVINYGGETLRNERKVYLLLNKPKDYITTTDDPQERHTVMELIAGACRERLYPVGRLDRNTVGLLLFTNDGEMAAKLMHPKFNVRKVYQVTLDKNLKTDDFEQLEQGVELEDGFIKPDEISFVSESKRDVGIEIHSGKNRVVRRIFEHLGYEVVKLDRVAYAGLTKKDLPRGKWRFLTTKEVGFLKMIG